MTARVLTIHSSGYMEKKMSKNTYEAMHNQGAPASPPPPLARSKNRAFSPLVANVLDCGNHVRVLARWPPV